MATIIRRSDMPQTSSFGAMNLNDFTAEVERHIAAAREEAERIIAEAQQQAEAIRQRAAEEGCQVAMKTVEQMVAEQWTPAIAALREATEELHRAKQTWVERWESQAVQLAVAIASRIVRKELQITPEITLTWVREALELASGSPGIRLHLHPDDYNTLLPEIKNIMAAISSLGTAEIVADSTVSRGGCFVETRFGKIDQQLESQLKRIEEELTS